MAKAKITKPKKLLPGDTVAFVSPASPFFRGEFTPAEVLQQARDALHDLGLRTVVGRHASDTYGYLAGTDADRANDFMEAFLNPDVQGVVCMGGGYGTPRLLDLLDYDAIAANPKVFVGYSDITALHTAIGQRAGLVTFHGPMGFELARIRRTLGPLNPPTSVVRPEGGAKVVARSGATSHGTPRTDGSSPAADAVGAKAAAFTWDWFARAFMNFDPIGELPSRAPWQDESLRSLVAGVTRGPLVGGNLSLLADTLGTPYEIDTAGKILLIEEVEEAPYRIDRMLTQLRLAGKLEAAAGFIVAEWTNCVPSSPDRPSLSLDQVLNDIIVPLGKPTVFGLPAGHGPGRLTLPFGVDVTVDGDRGCVVVEEPGVGPRR